MELIFSDIMNNYSQVFSLISQWEKFKELDPAGNLADFAGWVLKDANEQHTVDRNYEKVDRFEPGSSRGDENDTFPEKRLELVCLVARLNLFLKNYLKNPLQEAGLNSIDEFRLLQLIDRNPNINISQLSFESIMEFSTVTDILKRFLKKVLITQTPDPADGRASLLNTTSKGKEMLSKMNRSLSSFNPHISGNLTTIEQAIFIKTLEKLDRFHTDSLQNYPGPGK